MRAECHRVVRAAPCRLHRRCAGERRRPSRTLRLARIAPSRRGAGDAWPWGRWRYAAISWQYFSACQLSTAQQRQHSRGAGSKRRRSSDRSAVHHRRLTERAREATRQQTRYQSSRRRGRQQIFMIQRSDSAADGTLAASAINISSPDTANTGSHSGGPGAQRVQACAANDFGGFGGVLHQGRRRTRTINSVSRSACSMGVLDDTVVRLRMTPSLMASTRGAGVWQDAGDGPSSGSASVFPRCGRRAPTHRRACAAASVKIAYADCAGTSTTVSRRVRERSFCCGPTSIAIQYGPQTVPAGTGHWVQLYWVLYQHQYSTEGLTGSAAGGWVRERT